VTSRDLKYLTAQDLGLAPDLVLADDKNELTMTIKLPGNERSIRVEGRVPEHVDDFGTSSISNTFSGHAEFPFWKVLQA